MSDSTRNFPRVDNIFDGSKIKTLSKKEMAKELHGKSVNLIFVEEDNYNIIGFRYGDLIYIYESNIQ